MPASPFKRIINALYERWHKRNVVMKTYDFLVDDPSDDVVIASIEADSPKEAFARLQPWYEPYSLLWLPDYQEDEGPNVAA